MDYDLCVIGGGSAGTRAARIAAEHGAKVILAEEHRLGGTCVIRGCVPKKLLVLAGRIGDATTRAGAWGWQSDPATLDWGSLVARTQREITRLEGHYRQALSHAGVEIVQERAVLADARTIALGPRGSHIGAKTILIATGGHPARPVQYRDVGITSNEIFTRTELPRRLVIAGAGYIAVEFAGVFAALGSEVTLICRGAGLLAGFDRDLGRALEASYRERGITLMFQDTIGDVTRQGDTVEIQTIAGTRLRVDDILWAYGRTPNTARMGLESAGVATDALGAIIVDAQSRSTSPSIYAAGDVTNRANLTPVAIREGHAFADRVFGDLDWQLDYDLVPTAVFSTPEIAAIGLTEDEARSKMGRLEVARWELGAQHGGETPCFLKALIDTDTDRVVGVHAFASRASELVQGLAIAMTSGLTRDGILNLELLSADFEWVRMSTDRRHGDRL